MNGEGAVRFLVAGRVQGVGYRWFAAHHADRLGIRGLARNLPDGRVEVIAVGAAAAIAELERLLSVGPPTASVRTVERSDLSGTAPDFPGFGTA
ncbi:MAG TPA: acylphosphatase [Gemmatimonadales bacterium]|nr:acylphosphatase [Gemmatimonadales bacterium]